MEVIAPPILKETQSSPNFFVIVSFFIDVDTVPKKKNEERLLYVNTKHPEDENFISARQ